MKVLKNYFYNAIYQIFRILIPFITIPYLSRVLGPKGIGINSYTNSIIQYFIFLSDLGINVYGNRKIAYVRNNKYKLTQTFYEIMIMQVCIVMISYFMFFAFLVFFAHPSYKPYYLAQSIMIMAMAFDISWFFMGIEKFKVIVLRNFVVRLVVVFFIFSFVKSYNDLILYIVLFALSYLIGNITLFINLREYVGKPNVSDLHIWRNFWPAFTLFIPQIAGQVYGILNKNVLGVIDSSTSVGYFDQADKVTNMVLAIVTATGTVMLPHVAHAFSEDKYNKTRSYLYDSFSLVTALSVPISFGLIAISFKFVILFFTVKFLIVSPLIIIQSISIILIAWSNAIGIQYLLPTKQTKLYTWSITSGAIINVIVDIPLILMWGVKGSTVAYVISEATVTCCQIFFVRKQLSYKALFHDIYKYFVAGIVMFILVYIIDQMFPISWFMICVEVIIGSLIYLSVLVIERANVFSILKNMIHNNY